MNTFEFKRKLEAVTIDVVRAYGVGSVLLNQSKIINDLGDANARGKTFAGDEIAGIGKFSDWYETGEFFDKLRFADTDDIDLTSNGDGFEAIQESYSENDYIAPSAEVLSAQTMAAIKADFIQNIKNKLK
jgi:hypothetical protein